MSALESPPSLTPLWQDPWSTVVTASGLTGAQVSVNGTEDFYGSQHLLQNKVNVSPMIGNHQAAFYHSHHHVMNHHHQSPVMVPQGYHHPGMIRNDLDQNSGTGNQNNNNNSLNSDTNSSSTTSSTISTGNGNGGQIKNTSGSTGNNKRQVNFKLADIKIEPDPLSHHNHILPDNQPGGVQKVPSISDLSDQESSLDIPCNQVGLLLHNVYHIGWTDTTSLFKMIDIAFTLIIVLLVSIPIHLFLFFLNR